MCRSMIDIQSAAAEIRRGKRKKERRKIEETTWQKYNVRVCYARRSQQWRRCCAVLCCSNRRPRNTIAAMTPRTVNVLCLVLTLHAALCKSNYSLLCVAVVYLFDSDKRAVRAHDSIRTSTMWFLILCALLCCWGISCSVCLSVCLPVCLDLCCILSSWRINVYMPI